jgi:hypothetical protein
MNRGDINMIKVKTLREKIVKTEKIKFLFSIFSVFTLTGLLLLTGCTPYHAQKAPCDRFGTGCGAKIRINAC